MIPPKGVRAILLLLLLAVPAWSQTIRLPVEVKGDPGTFIRVVADTDGAHVRWYALDSGLALFPVDLLKDSKTAVVIAQAKGRYRLIAWTAKGDVPSLAVETVVVIGEVPPVPPGPVPPGPVPPVPPSPIPLDGFRVLVVVETADLSKLPAGQLAALYSERVRGYLNQKCVKEDGRPAWNVWDKDVSTDLVPKHWQDAMKRPRGSVPWILISTGKDGYEGPFPATEADTLALLAKYGG